MLPNRKHPILSQIALSPLAARLAHGTAWSIFGIGAARGLTFLSMVLLARLLGKEAYGEFGIIRATAHMLLTFAGFGIGLTATKYVSEFLATDKKRVGRVIAMSYLFTLTCAFVLSLGVFVQAPWIGESLLCLPHCIDALRIGAVILFFVVVAVAQNGVMMGFQDFCGLALTAILVGVISLPLYVMAALWYGVAGALAAMLVSVVINVIVNGWRIYAHTRRHGICYDFCGVRYELPLLWRFSLPRFFCELLVIVLMWSCQVFVVRGAHGATEIGIFFAAYSIHAILSFLPAQISSVIFLVQSEKLGEGNQTQWKRILIIHLVVGLACSFAVAIPTALFSRQIMGLYGSTFCDGWPVLYVICLESVFHSLIYVFHGIFASQGKMWTWLGITGLGMVANITVVVWGTHYFPGSFALALGMLSGKAISCGLIVRHFVTVGKVKGYSIFSFLHSSV